MLKSVTELFQRWRDQVRRRVAIWIWDRPNSSEGLFDNRVVFVRWDAKLGDTVVLSWVFRELKRQRPDLAITVITGESFEDLFKHGYGIGSVYLAGKRHGAKGLKRIAHQIRRPRYVVHLSLKWRARDMQFVRQLDPRHVVGLDDELTMVDVKLGAQTEGRHFSEKLVPWLEQIGVDTRDRDYWIPRLPAASDRVEQWWPKGTVVALCPYGASRKKRLNAYWIETVIQAVIDQGASVVMLVLPSERPALLELVQRNGWQHHVFWNAGQSTHYDLFEQVARCDAVVSVDTAIVHIAVGLCRPLLALYNSSGLEFEHWHPNSSQTIILRCKADMSERDNGLSQEQLRQAIVTLMR